MLSALLAAGAVSCGKTGRQDKTVPDAPGAARQEEISLHGEGPNVLPAADRTAWGYEPAPTPDPGVEPAYLLRSFAFEKGSHAINKEGQGVLKELAQVMKKRPQVELLILSFCDKVSENVNAVNLGLHRSREARDALVSHGVTRDRLKIATFGATQAKADIHEPVGQERDRRVEIWLIRE